MYLCFDKKSKFLIIRMLARLQIKFSINKGGILNWMPEIFFNTTGIFRFSKLESSVNFTQKQLKIVEFCKQDYKCEYFQHSFRKRQALYIFHQEQEEYDGLKQHTFIIRLLILKSHSGSCKLETQCLKFPKYRRQNSRITRFSSQNISIT